MQLQPDGQLITDVRVRSDEVTSTMEPGVQRLDGNL